jgi:hypothetical protein
MVAIKILTAAQYAILNKIARRTKMDCWFCIKQDSSGQDYVFDLEEGYCVELGVGIGQLMEGLDCPENVESCDLNWIEKTVLVELLKVLNVKIPESLEVR